MKREPCLWCGRPASLLCDETLALVLDETHTAYPATSMEAMLSGSYTCDAPMCARCARRVGWVHAHGKLEDTIDHCPYHAVSPEPLRKPMTLDEIASLRRQVHATVRRQAMRAR